MAKPPAPVSELRTEYGPHLNYAPPGGWDRSTGEGAVRTREDALLVLRHAVRHPAEGPREPTGRDSSRGRSSRTIRACCARRALSAICRAVHPDRLTHPFLRGANGFLPMLLRRSAGRHGAAAHRDPRSVRPRRHRHIRRRLHGHGEGVRAREVRAGGDRHAGTSTTTAGCAWCRRGPPTSSTFGIDRAPNPWSDIPLPTSCW